MASDEERRRMIESTMASAYAGGGMWIAGAFGLLPAIVLVLAAAALIKYLPGTRDHGHG
jgi:hypothetical protein